MGTEPLQHLMLTISITLYSCFHCWWWLIMNMRATEWTAVKLVLCWWLLGCVSPSGRRGSGDVLLHVLVIWVH